MIKIETVTRWGGARPGAGGKRKPVAPARPDLARWYCLRTDYEADVTAADAVRAAGFEVFAPMEWRAPRAAKRLAHGAIRPARPAGVVPMFPRYLFVRFSRADPWQRIHDLAGVEGLLGIAQDSPSPMPDLAILLIRGWCQANDCKYPDNFDLHNPHALPPCEVGAALRLLGGAMAGQVGVCEWSDTKGTRLLVSLLGRDNRVTVLRSWVEAA